MSGEPSLTVSKEEATELSFGEKKLLGILVCCDSCQEDGITDEICQHRDHNYTSQLCSRIRQLKNWKRADNAINYVTSLTKAREERLLLLHLTEEKLQDVRLLRTLSRRRKKIAPSPPGHLIKTVSSNLPTNPDNGSSHGTLNVIQELPVSSAQQFTSSYQPLPRMHSSLTPETPQAEDNTDKISPPPSPQRKIPRYQPPHVRERERLIHDPTSKNQLSDQRRKVRKPLSVITKHHVHKVTPLMSITVSVYQKGRIRNHRKHEVGSTSVVITRLML